MILKVDACTDTGKVREMNEDSYLLMPEKALFALADGMGGHAHGEVASTMAIESIREVYQNGPSSGADDTPVGAARLLEKAVTEANRKIFQRAEECLSLKSMGTTVVALKFLDGYALVSHIGDSRAYRLRNGQLEQLSEDHSLVNEYVRLGLLKRSEAAFSPLKNIIMRALGLNPGLMVEVKKTDCVPGDRYMLCSDGLTDLVPDREILPVLRGPSVEHMASELVSMALAKGGKDNVTVIVVGVEA